MWPTGPNTTDERFEWAGYHWTQMSPSRRDRLIRNLRRLKPSSAFSGYGGLEWVLWFIVGFINTVIATPLVFPKSFQAGDRDRSRLKVLQAFDNEHAPLHLTQDIISRFPDQLAAEIKTLLPSRDSHIDAKRFAYQEIKAKLYAHGQEHPVCFACSPCLNHLHLR